MLPLVVSEQLIHRFKFFSLTGKIEEGMRHGSELYSHTASFLAERREQAYELACKLCEKNSMVVVSCSEEGYGVWTGLRASNQLELEPKLSLLC